LVSRHSSQPAQLSAGAAAGDGRSGLVPPWPNSALGKVLPRELLRESREEEDSRA